MGRIRLAGTMWFDAGLGETALATHGRPDRDPAEADCRTLSSFRLINTGKAD